MGGHRRHGADDITEGERLNLIVWNHNEEFRKSSLHARHHMQTPKTYEPESGPPDKMCLSFTHDRDYGVFKEYDAKSLQHRGEDGALPTMQSMMALWRRRTTSLGIARRPRRKKKGA